MFTLSGSAVFDAIQQEHSVVSDLLLPSISRFESLATLCMHGHNWPPQGAKS